MLAVQPLLHPINTGAATPLLSFITRHLDCARELLRLVDAKRALKAEYEIGKGVKQNAFQYVKRNGTPAMLKLMTHA